MGENARSQKCVRTFKKLIKLPLVFVAAQSRRRPLRIEWTHSSQSKNLVLGRHKATSSTPQGASSSKAWLNTELLRITSICTFRGGPSGNANDIPGSDELSETVGSHDTRHSQDMNSQDQSQNFRTSPRSKRVRHVRIPPGGEGVEVRDARSRYRT